MKGNEHSSKRTSDRSLNVFISIGSHILKIFNKHVAQFSKHREKHHFYMTKVLD